VDMASSFRIPQRGWAPRSGLGFASQARLSAPASVLHTAKTTTSTSWCLRLRICLGSDNDSKYDPMEPTSTSLAMTGILANGRHRPSPSQPWLATDRSPFATKISGNSKWRKPRRLPSYARWPCYEDEVDIHLNPKIGLDWMVPGQQKEVRTPGQNVKRYLAGALNAHTKQLIWVEAERKTSALFIDLLRKLVQTYVESPVIHVILDNYRIHDSKIVHAALRGFDGRIQLHFLPPYCPDHNRIERVWQDLHANVTRNHRCPNMTSLMSEVRYYLRKRNRNLTTRSDAKATEQRAAA
jgi:transposase